MPTLYGHPFSRAQRNIWMLNELGIPYDIVPIDFRIGEAGTPEFLAINPNARVPALVDDGFAIYESLAINLYLARKYPGQLSVTGIDEESLANQWTLWVTTEVDKPLLLAAMNHRLFPLQDRDVQESAMALRKLDRPFRVLDTHLQRHDYLLGDRFTVADVNVASVMTLIPICGIPTRDYPAMTAWLSRCQQRPAALAAWKDIDFSIPRPSAEDLNAMFL